LAISMLAAPMMLLVALLEFGLHWESRVCK